MEAPSLPNPHFPEDLAEKVAAPGHRCKIPFTHDRLQECHYWWHQIARAYHEPDPFRFSFTAFIQAARSITFMLQKEQKQFKDFGWYRYWVEYARTNPVLSWLQKIRTRHVHQEALVPNSWMEMRCINNPRSNPWDDEEERPFNFKVSPFLCTHYYIGRAAATDHCHEFIRFWAIDSLKGREILEACAEIYAALDELVTYAHQQLGGSIQLVNSNDPESVATHGIPKISSLPCMADVLTHRIVRTKIQNGIETWENEPSDLHG